VLAIRRDRQLPPAFAERDPPQWLAAPQATASHPRGSSASGARHPSLAILQETTMAGVLQYCCQSAAALQGTAYCRVVATLLPEYRCGAGHCGAAAGLRCCCHSTAACTELNAHAKPQFIKRRGSSHAYHHTRQKIAVHPAKVATGTQPWTSTPIQPRSSRTFSTLPSRNATHLPTPSTESHTHHRAWQERSFPMRSTPSPQVRSSDVALTHPWG
jgi:hypothetical protein